MWILGASFSASLKPGTEELFQKQYLSQVHLLLTFGTWFRLSFSISIALIYWLVGSSLPSDFNPTIIQKILNELSPDRVRIFWESKKFEGLTDKVEPWYGTAFSVEKVNPSMIQGWMTSAPNENLHLPAPNVFIPTDLSIKNAQEKIKFLVLLRKSSYSKLWFKPDMVFSTPKAYVKIDFNCPYASSTPETEVLADIFARLLMDYLNEYAYYATVAGLHYGISLSESGFEVTLVGYNHKLRILLETVVDEIAKFEVKPDRFSVIKDLVSIVSRHDTIVRWIPRSCNCEADKLAKEGIG
ncbi:hypothetical protein F3Y22_tig00001290pilonHSYRG00004 [Hibiscus syriacus]|uniref:Peptidase M16 middle/third domain-containing protein n=1 Tax=Hibiscus syriacus TaxID=106335 RepID=A0A6A3D1Z0_HIBSY|nr:hypothetical protein F3Y22_tig00001290pilonHSYRG00004 [Hibiscus syriacus]